MIRIHTAMEYLWLDPEELRGYKLIGFFFLVQQGKVRYVSEDQYKRENWPEIGSGKLWQARLSGGVFRGIHWCIELTLKNGERYLINAGLNYFDAASIGEQLISMIDESIVRGAKLTVIDVCQLLEERRVTADMPVKLISGKEAEDLLAQRFSPILP